MNKLPLVLAALGILVTLVPAAVRRCAASIDEKKRDIYFCQGNVCQNLPSRGKTVKRSCTSWVCVKPDGTPDNTQFDPSSCDETVTETNTCCTPGEPPWVPA